MDAHPFFDGLDAQIICGAVGHAAANATASQPHTESRRMMIAALVALCCGSSAEFSTPDNQRLIEQSSRLQIAN